MTATGVAADYSSANVGSYPEVVITYTLHDGAGGGLAANYSLANGSASGQITPKALSVTAPAIASKGYDGTATAGTVTVGTLSGFVGSQTVTATAKLGGTAQFAEPEAPGTGTTSDGKPYTVDSVAAGGTPVGTLDSKDVGTNNVTITGVTVTGTGNGDYTVTQQAGLTQEVTPKALTALGTLSVPPSKV